MGLHKKRLYKPERAHARTKGVIAIEHQAPVGCPDANHAEIAMALASICISTRSKDGKPKRFADEGEGIFPARGGTYDAIRDEYTIIGKIGGKAQDIKIEGVAVAALINQLRVWNGGAAFDKKGLTEAVGGL